MAEGGDACSRLYRMEFNSIRKFWDIVRSDVEADEEMFRVRA